MLPNKNKEKVPFFYTTGELRSIFISLFYLINSGLIEKYCGVGIEASAIWKSAELNPLWLEFRRQAREAGWDAVKELTGKAAVIALFRQMIITMALNKRPNVKPESVYSTAEFIRFSRKCDVVFSTEGSFIEYGPKFRAFLEAYNIN
jgi:hypothetical protein